MNATQLTNESSDIRKKARDSPEEAAHQQQVDHDMISSEITNQVNAPATDLAQPTDGTPRGELERDGEAIKDSRGLVDEYLSEDGGTATEQLDRGVEDPGGTKPINNTE